jgi:hypothetical protein
MNDTFINQRKAYVTEKVLSHIDFVTRLYPLELKQLINRGCVAGGAISSVIRNERPKDYDIFFNKEDAAAIYKYFGVSTFFKTYAFRQDGRDYDTHAFVTPNAISLPKRIQLIGGITGETPEEIVAQFDFVHTKAYINLSSNVASIPENTIVASLLRVIKYEPNQMPKKAFKRMLMLMQKGWNCDLETIIEIAMLAKDSDENLKTEY